MPKLTLIALILSTFWITLLYKLQYLLFSISHLYISISYFNLKIKRAIFTFSRSISRQLSALLFYVYNLIIALKKNLTTLSSFQPHPSRKMHVFPFVASIIPCPKVTIPSNPQLQALVNNYYSFDCIVKALILFLIVWNIWMLFYSYVLHEKFYCNGNGTDRKDLSNADRIYWHKLANFCMISSWAFLAITCIFIWNVPSFNWEFIFYTTPYGDPTCVGRIMVLVIYRVLYFSCWVCVLVIMAVWIRPVYLRAMLLKQDDDRDDWWHNNKNSWGF